MLWIIFRAGWLSWGETGKRPPPPSRVGAIIDDLFILLARCTLLHHLASLFGGPSPFRSDRNHGFISTWIIYLPPIYYPSMPPWNHAFAPLFAADPGLCIIGLAGPAAPAFHFEKSARFPFHRKQLPLNIFIRRLIILCRSSFLTTVYLQRSRFRR